MIKNPHIAELVDAYLLDALEPHERERVAQHLESCEACQAEFARGEARLRTLRALPPVEVSSDLLSATEQRLAAAWSAHDSDSSPASTSFPRSAWERDPRCSASPASGHDVERQSGRSHAERGNELKPQQRSRTTKWLFGTFA
ncbi:MAG: zf-HC2 domain-containing protein, partial [Planctomycetaceae bacterium]|nr:zf-HC2 domain-containing protein [Planctomycetaceae bacterium]